MKTIRNTNLFTALLLASFLLIGSSSCTQLYKKSLIRGKGNTQTEIQQITGIRHLFVHNGIEVEIIQGDQEAIEIKAPENILPYVEIKQEGELLHLSLSDENRYIDAGVKATLTTRSLHSLSLTGGSEVFMRGNFSSPRFEAILSGGSDLKNFNMETEDCVMQLSGASEISGYITAPKMLLKLSGASEVSIVAPNTEFLVANLSGASELEIKGNGQTREAIATLSGASSFEAPSIVISKGTFHLSGASEAEACVKDEVSYILSGASSLSIVGTPKVLSQSLSGSSDVEFR